VRSVCCCFFLFLFFREIREAGYSGLFGLRNTRLPFLFFSFFLRMKKEGTKAGPIVLLVGGIDRDGTAKS
jgi:hypothetical protein